MYLVKEIALSNRRNYEQIELISTKGVNHKVIINDDFEMTALSPYCNRSLLFQKINLFVDAVSPITNIKVYSEDKNAKIFYRYLVPLNKTSYIK